MKATHPTEKNYLVALLAAATLAVVAADTAALAGEPGHTADPNSAKYRQWIAEIKAAPRGPFERIRWFCKDGTVLAPVAYACANHGGGIQHGEWTERVVTIRDSGYWIANVLAELKPADFTGKAPDLTQLSQLLLERFLMQADDGWVFRATYTYRGALQAEDEEAGALAVVQAMLSDPAWRTPSRFLMMRETARLLPIQTDDVSASEVRQLALDIAEQDDGFTQLRVKIHGTPDGSDAAAVRDYASKNGKAALKAEYQRLAGLIDELYAPRGGVETLGNLAEQAEDAAVADVLRERAKQLATALSPPERLRVAGYGMMTLRDKFEAGTSPADGLSLLLASITLERIAYTAGNDLSTSLGSASRKEQLTWLGRDTAAVYGMGFISKRELLGSATTIKRLFDEPKLTLEQYRTDLRYLARIPEWAAAMMNFNFIEATNTLSQIEPLAHLYIQDRLRGSPLLLCSTIVDNLGKDANAVAGIEHSLFGKRAGAGLRALNPGITRGVLYSPKDASELSRTDPNGIYVLPETISALPPVAGILTQGEGSSLSHVQLLARNLGIPNVVVGNEVLGEVRKHVGEKIVMAVSPFGVVQLEKDGPQWDETFGKEVKTSDVIIRPDLDKLNVEITDMVPLSELRATDSGRISGPKGANLGELKHHFGDTVPGGFVIPFGAFRVRLDDHIEPGGPLVYDWMKLQYAAIAALDGQPEKQRELVAKFLGRLRGWIETTDQGPEFRAQLKQSLEQQFGKGESYGAFVRSDTNVEDLAGFTGAGLNKTIPNVVGFENIVSAVRQVWASPFTERAYGWRQSHMESPEYVFPAVVVQYSFPAEKSGVMVTTDLEGGGDGWLSVAISEGVGGAVDGQAAEQLRINRETEEVLFLAQASAPYKSVLDPSGGVKKVRASGTDTILNSDEIKLLIEFAAEAPANFPSLRTEDGGELPADVEFAFRGGRLALLQLRPFVESKSAQRNVYLNGLDAEFEKRAGTRIRLDDKTGGAK
jgi:hypothetical protein